LITGATGSIGKNLVRELGERDQRFRAFVRNAERGRALGCELAIGDFDSPETVAKALVGVDRVFLNAAGAQPAEGEQPMVRQQKTVIDAARAAGVSHVVKVSVLDAGEGGRLAEGAHWEIEQYLKNSGLPWSILQPNGFMQNFTTGAGAFSDDGNLIGAYGQGRVSYIDAADIAAAGAVLLAQGTGIGETFRLSGPESLNHAEIAEKLSRALGRIIRYVDLPPDQFAAQLVAQGLPESFAADVAFLFVRLGTGLAAEVTPAVRELTGRDPRSFDQFLADDRDLFF
jgi:uncharacterized protein YbjT (DUF2867 family)